MLIIRARTLMIVGTLIALCSAVYVYALIGAGTGTFPPTAAGHLLSATLPLIFAAGAVPRRFLIGKRKLTGPASAVFEIARALAVAVPALALFSPSPGPAAGFILSAASSVLIMRAVARRVIANRADLRASVFSAPTDGRSLAAVKSANSGLIATVSAISLLTPIAVWFAGCGLAPMIIAPIVLASVSVLLGFHAEHFRRVEEEQAYERHLEGFFSHCLVNDVRDVIHYAGGSPDLVSAAAKRVTESGRKVAVIARDVPSFERAEKAGLRCVLARKIADLDRIVTTHLLRVHYPNETQRAGHMVRFSRMKHILHADKVQGPSGQFPGYLSMYDAVVTKTEPTAKVVSSAARVGVKVLHAKKGVVSGMFEAKKETR